MIERFTKVLLLILMFFPLIKVSEAAVSGSNAKRKIVLIAGEKSHPAGTHEYIKTVRLIKTLLDNSNVAGAVETEVHLNGWPQDEKTLEDANLILFASDGNDGYNFGDVPFFTPDRMKVMERQIKRGCGLSLLHFSTFATYPLGQTLLNWAGGYFDWQDSTGKRKPYSALKETEAEIKLLNTNHSIHRGVRPFNIRDEFYYNMRFSQHLEDFRPLLSVPQLGSELENGNVVAWALNRTDGGRAFCSTMNHYYSNWENGDYRKFMLNGIAWASGVEIPEKGVEARFFNDEEVTSHIYHKTLKALLITEPGIVKEGSNTANLKKALETDRRILVDVSSNINDIWQYNLRDYNLLVLNRKDTSGINKYSKEVLENYLKNGGALISLVFHYPSSGRPSDINTAGWPEYRSIFRREIVTDQYSNKREAVTIEGRLNKPRFKKLQLNLYDGLMLQGEMPVTTFFSFKYNHSGKSIPAAWTYPYGKGRVAQSILGLQSSDFNSNRLRELFAEIVSEVIDWP
ncbi:ThuA domain-containing protein [Desertivirga arenae]|uniref:ThuA domain-containing protein n=1 Tax=Desertivirga arenae TaxID=2810309 RepID=UPI001A9685F1|nr:ThuA domain-containing protein [Pedobacter sp. SYSU D00823]